MNNPYINDTGKPLLIKSVVAFIDILGYKEKIKEIETAGEIQNFIKKFKKILDDSFFRVSEYQLFHYYKMKSFSDNILIGYPIREDCEQELISVFGLLTYLQINMSLQGFFLRGAITIGNLYIDEDIIMGEGLLSAYNAERELARDPRIILTDSALVAVKEHLKYYAEHYRDFAPQRRYLLKDADGQYFLNYLLELKEPDESIGPFVEEMNKHKQVIEKNLNKYLQIPRVWSKYAWAANYHNYFCIANPEFEVYKINLDDFQLRPSKIEFEDSTS